MTRALRNIPADRARLGRVVIVVVNLAALAAYLLWAMTLSPVDEPGENLCAICLDPRQTAVVYGVIFALPVIVISLAFGLTRYGRRPKVRNSPVPLRSIEPALADAAGGLALGLVAMVLVHLVLRLWNLI